jgi:hypothetical protein
MRRAAPLVALLWSMAAGCSLFTSLDGFDTPPVTADPNDAGEAGSSSDGSATNDASTSCVGGDTRTLDGHCYFLLSNRMTQPDAKAACQAAGAHLLTESSDAEHALADDLASGDHWIGLESEGMDGNEPLSVQRATFKWVTNEPVLVDYWAPDSPDEMGRCVALIGDEWNDRRCDETNRAICERE